MEFNLEPLIHSLHNTSTLIVLLCFPKISLFFLSGSSGAGSAATLSLISLASDGEASEIWPFQVTELQSCGCAPGWLVQQLLKPLAKRLGRYRMTGEKHDLLTS